MERNEVKWIQYIWNGMECNGMEWKERPFYYWFIYLKGIPLSANIITINYFLSECNGMKRSGTKWNE